MEGHNVFDQLNISQISKFNQFHGFF